MESEAPTQQEAYYGGGEEGATPPHSYRHHQEHQQREDTDGSYPPAPFPESEKDETQPPLEKGGGVNETTTNDKATSTPPIPTDDKENNDQDEALMEPTQEAEDLNDPIVVQQNEIIANGTPSTTLEVALFESLQRKELHIARLTNELVKLKAFISKRKQTYKRKRKHDGAPTRAMSAYNFFIKDRFAQLSKANEKALKSENADAEMKRVPPSSLITSTGNAWKELSAEQKQKYEEQAKLDRKRFEEEMQKYCPPDKQANRKRNKTGYNMFFSAHVLRLKQTESGVPSERGSVARLVGTAWKKLPAEEKVRYEKEADKHNGMHPQPRKEGGENEDDAEEVIKRQQQQQQQQQHANNMDYPNYPHPDLHMPPPQQQQHMAPPPHYDHRQQQQQQQQHYYPPHMYGPPPPYGYDYSQHHQRTSRAAQQGYPYPPPPPPPRGYEP